MLHNIIVMYVYIYIYMCVCVSLLNLRKRYDSRDLKDACMHEHIIMAYPLCMCM